MRFFRALWSRLRRIDPVLFAASGFLSFMSILTIFGSVHNFGRSKLIMQCAMTAAGMIAVFILANCDYRFFVDRFAVALFIGSVALLGITLLFGSSGQNMETGNKSWLNIPLVNIAIQPSEFVKIAFICTFSKHISLVWERLNHPKVLLGLLLHAGAIVGLILCSGDLGVALVYAGIILFMLFFAGLSGWYFLGGAALVTISVPFLWDLLKPYQKNRIVYGFQVDLESAPLDIVRQPRMSREAIARGGIFGNGLFSGGIYEDLAASHTAFIFATVCEKFGFVGGGLVVLALAVLAIRLLWLGMTARDRVGSLICSGIAAVIIVQTVENLWMCLAKVPVVGITLPFMSAGGSSLFALYILLGLAHSVSATERGRYFSAAG